MAVAVNGVLLARSSRAYVAVAGLLVVALAAALASGAALALRDPASHGLLAGSERRAYAVLLLVAVIGVLDIVALL